VVAKHKTNMRNSCVFSCR